jgi:transglutaminase-like putative cysteine protease
MIDLPELRSFRPPDQQPNRLACNGLLISAALAIGFHSSRLPLWLTAFAACLLLWRFLIENHAWRVPGRIIRWSLLFVTVVIVFRHYGTLFGRDAGVAYLTLLLALKILEIRSLRDYVLVVFLIFLIVLGALLFSQSLPTAVYAMLVIVATVHALVRLNSPYPLGQGPTLVLVVTMVIQALPLLLVLYLLFPRIQGSLWSLPIDAHSGRTGMSERVSPGSINQLYEDDTIAFRAEFDGQPPPADSLYWRIFVLSDTDGRNWFRHPGPWDGANIKDYQPVDDATPYTVLLQPHDQRWIPTLELAASTPPSTHRASGYVLESNKPVKNLRRYDLSSHLSYSTPRLDNLQARHNTLWPIEPSRRVQGLLRGWQEQGTKPREIILQVLKLFSQDPFRYTLSPPLLTGDTLDQFLFETRAGYCEHYASAFAALMRLSGIPTRLVVGYQGGEWNGAGDYIIVRQSDAHAWTEVWLHPKGWVRVDPTAAIAPERIELGADALRRLDEQGAQIGLLSINDARRMIAPDFLQKFLSDLSLRWDNVNNSWNKWVMAYGPKAQLELLKLIGIKTPDWVDIVAGMILAVLFLLFATAAIWMVRTRQRPDPAVKLYLLFCRKLKKAGLERQPTEGPTDFAKRVASARADLSVSVSRITSIYVALRYGRNNPSAIPVLRKLVYAFKATG